MRLEHVEEICLNFLRQTMNPLTQVELLYNMCVADPQVGDSLTRDALIQFLRGHADLLVVDGVGTDDLVDRSGLEDAGISTGPCVILKSRVPTRAEMVDMVRQQIADMRRHLYDALNAAKQHCDAKAIAEIESVLERTETIEERIEDF